jgi:hypothetical protein
LSDRRDDLVAERTRILSRLHVPEAVNPCETG